MDLSKLSDEDLAALQVGDMSKMSDEGLAHLSEPEPAAPSAPEEPSLKGGSVRGMGLGSLMDLIRPGFSQGEGHGVVKAGTLGNVNIDSKSDDDVGHAIGTAAGTAAVASAAPTSAAKSAFGRIAGNTALSAAQGALQKPEGEDTLANRAKGAGIAALISGPLNTLGEGASWLLGKGAKTAQNIRDIKSGEMANRAQGAIDDAAQQIGDQVIQPKADKLKELLQGETMQVNPDRVKPVFPNLGGKMSDKLEQDAANQGLAIAGGPEASAASRIDISGPRALRLKQAADSAAKWQRKIGVGDADAVAKEADAAGLANILRRQINADPERAALNQGMEDAFGLRDALTNREVASPIETLTAPVGSSRGAIVDQTDKMVGTGLRKMGDDITTAKGLLLDPTKLAHPLQAPGEILRSGSRGAVEAASLADALRNKSPVSQQQLINALIQQREGNR